MAQEASPEKSPRRSAEECAKAAILANPDFVLTDPDIMRALLSASAPARPDARQVVDLRAAAIDRLERRLARLQAAHRDIVDAAWDSLSSLEPTHQSALALIEARDATALASVARLRLPELLEVDAARLALERSAAPDGFAAQGGATLEDGFVARRLAGPALIDGQLLLTSLDGASRAPGVASAVFELDAEGVRSAAYLLLGRGSGAACGLLALGSADPDRFCAGRNADLLKFLGDVLDRRLDALGAAARPATARRS